MSNTKHLVHAAIGAVSILVIGGVLGVLLDRVALAHSSASEPEHPTATLALDARHEEFLQELQDDLGLTAEQAKQVHEILSRHQGAVNEAWSAVHTILEAAIDSVTSEIEAVLEPAQRRQLHEWLLERHGRAVSHEMSEGLERRR
jgi:Spy/CpxP family protein refolding chaperone